MEDAGPEMVSIFAGALERESDAERAAFLDEACRGDAALRRRVEALLKSHTEAGGFLGNATPHSALDDTQAETIASDDLGFLAPSGKPGSLGRLGHYEVQEIVGRGGMGVVLRAFDEKLHRVVAIKVMAAPLATNATARKRFVREAQAQAAVSHDHVVTIHAVEGEDGPLPYLVMQYVPGLSLQQRLSRDGPLELHEVLRIGMQTAAGLAAAHKQGLVHRDVKPANILLENGVERVKVTDFGLARAADDASLTQSGVVAGTPHFMSPEQARGEAVDQRSDLFSLGSVLYAMCAGRPPFRAGNALAVLKRVCDETPTPIRDANPAIPDWLIGIIDKLHAKEPAQRYQSAAEVAEALGRHLAEVQHPSFTPLSPLGRGAGGEGRSQAATGAFVQDTRPARRRRLAIAAASLLCLAVGLSLTEATGVTSLRSAVARILTPDGTLVVETDDPAVKVTVEGDGGLVITGAGLEEIRLRPGSYRVHADRDGKRLALDRDLVTVSRGDRVIVRVKVEAADTRLTPAEGFTQPRAFVLVSKGVAGRKFDTFAEAVAAAADSDVIEIRGNGPFVTPGVKLGSKALTVRAGDGHRPVLRLDPERAKAYGTLIETDAPLVLEGLELQIVGGPPPKTARLPEITRTVRSHQAPLFIAHCRFLVEGEGSGISIVASPVCDVRHCEIFSAGNLWWRLGWKASIGGRLAMDNNVIAGGGEALCLWNDFPDLADVSVRLSRNTIASRYAITWLMSRLPRQDAKMPEAKTFRLHATANLFDVGDGVLHVGQPGELLARTKPLTASEVEALVPKALAWSEAGNLYRSDTTFVRLTVEGRRIPPALPITDLPRWKAFWALPSLEALHGQPRYEGKAVLEKLMGIGSLDAAGFRLAAKSPGKGDGPGGADVGADVDRVGPGVAYERWKKTPEYQEWLRDSAPRLQFPPPARK